MENGRKNLIDSRRTRHRGCLMIVLCLTYFQQSIGVNSCPVSCFCYLDHEPRRVACDDRGLQDYPANISGLVQHLDLSKNMLETLPDELNSLTELLYLNLANNKLTSLPNDLRQLKQLQRLDLTNNNIADISDIASVSQLTGLKVLYLSKNPLKSLDQLTNVAVRALDVGRCSISNITSASLKGLPELVTLSLEGNPLKSIQRLTSEKLRWLDMSDCFLNYLSSDTFEGAPDLEQLRLSNNPRLVYSSGYETLQHKNLKKFDVSKCNLDRPGLHGLTALTHAVLSHNAIGMLPDRIFAKNPMLTQLHLNSNHLTKVNRSSFAGLKKLEAIDLSFNSIDNLHPSTFRDAVSLRLLNLSFNEFQLYPNLMTSVMSLDLTGNNIENVPREYLTDMPRLRTLNLSDNQLEGVCDKFESETLRTLIIRRNRLVQLANNSFADLPALQKLDLSGNRLTEGMDPEVFGSNVNLRSVILEDNPWRCDCSQLYRTFLYLMEIPKKTESETLVCQSPSNVSGFSWETACYDDWHDHRRVDNDRTWGLVMISLLVIVIMCGTSVSLRHTWALKRRERRERLRREQAEGVERLRLLRRSAGVQKNTTLLALGIERLDAKNMELEAISRNSTSEPRVHPLELINPPPYEEAVQMPRLAQSLDALDSISMGALSSQVIGSMESLRARKRRQRRPRNRARSEENLSRRDDRIPSRRVRSAPRRNYSTSVLTESARTDIRSTETVRYNNATKTVTPIGNRRDTESEEPSSDSKRRPRPQTPNAKRKRRRQPLNNGHSTDDEDSDIQNCVTAREINTEKSIVIRELPREPRSGYRPNVQAGHIV